MHSNIFIPKKIKVGFNNRKDTYTGKLAYVIYYDQKNKLRKAASWESWRNKDIPVEDYENEPTSGFVLNKNVGGYAYHWDARKSYIRIYDSRGFEFEITLPNLLYILENTNSIKGKGLEGEFVYGWDGKDLILVPVSSPEYQAMQAMTDKLFTADTIKPSALKLGHVYLTAKGERYVFMGNHVEYRYHSNYVSYSTSQHEIDEWIADGYVRDNTVANSNRYVKPIPSNKPKAWLVRLYSDGKAEMCCRSSVSKFFFEQEGDCPHNDYHIFEAALNSCQDYHPVDYSATEFVALDIDEFRNTLQTKWNKAKERNWYEDYLYHTLDEQGLPTSIRVKFRGQSDIIHREEVGHSYSYWGKEYPTTLDELCTKYKPIQIVTYLQNKNKTEAKHLWRLLDGYKE